MPGRMPEYIKFPVTLTLVSLISAAALAGLWKITLPAKQAMAAEETRLALARIFTDADSFEERSAKIDGRRFEYRAAIKGGREIGYAAKGRARGYSSVIEVLAGVDPDFRLRGVEVLSQKETPGLGDKVGEILSKKTWRSVITGTSPDESNLRPWFQVQFDGKSVPVKVKKDGGTIESITGATISSRAVCDAVNQAVVELKKVKGSS